CSALTKGSARASFVGASPTHASYRGVLNRARSTHPDEVAEAFKNDARARALLTKEPTRRKKKAIRTTSDGQFLIAGPGALCKTPATSLGRVSVTLEECSAKTFLSRLRD